MSAEQPAIDPNDVPIPEEDTQGITSKFIERSQAIGHNMAITSIKVNTDHTMLVSASRDKTALVWQLPKTNENWALPQARLIGHNHFVSSASISSDSSYVLTSSWDKTLRLWNVANHTTKTLFKGHTKDVLDVTFSPDNRRIISCGRDNTVRVWNVIGEVAMELKTPSWATCVSCAPLATPQDPLIFAVGLWDGNVIVYKLTDKVEELHTIHAHDGRCQSVAFTPDGQWLITGGSDRKVVLWNSQTGEKIISFTATAVINYLCACPNRAWITAATYEGIHVWDISEKQQIDLVDFKFEPRGKRNAGRKPDCTTICWSEDGQILYAGYNDGLIRVWEVRSQ